MQGGGKGEHTLSPPSFQKKAMSLQVKSVKGDQNEEGGGISKKGIRTPSPPFFVFKQRPCPTKINV